MSSTTIQHESQSTIRIADIENEIEFIRLTLERLIRERQKITRRGRLTSEEDKRLDQIDTEIEHWEQRLDDLEDYMEEIHQSYEENEVYLE
jgi:predicted  nucleic acid-binding Zn-ribbon protein